MKNYIGDIFILIAAFLFFGGVLSTVLWMIGVYTPVTTEGKEFNPLWFFGPPFFFFVIGRALYATAKDSGGSFDRSRFIPVWYFLATVLCVSFAMMGANEENNSMAATVGVFALGLFVKFLVSVRDHWFAKK